MKEVQKLLKMVSEGLKTLAQRVEAIADTVDEAEKTKGAGKAGSQKKPAPVKPAKTVSKKPIPVKKTAPKVVPQKTVEPATAIDTVLNIISSSKTGVNTAAIKAETGYDQKKISNIVYKLTKLGKIKTVQKGVYVKS